MDLVSTAQAYRQRSSDERAAREATRQTVLSQVTGVLRSALTPGMNAWIFGSLANGEYSARSDIDVAVTGLSVGALGLLERALAAATGRAVDLLVLEMLPADFQDRIVREGLRISGDAQ